MAASSAETSLPSTGSDPAGLILASASPRRLALLRQIGIEPTGILPADIDESVKRGELPREHAARLASEKAAAITAGHSGDYVLAADTVVALGRRILPKAEDRDTARRCLELLSGRKHKVFGGVVVVAPDGRQTARLVETRVAVKRLSHAEMESYLKSEEWHGKAGGYAIQGLAAAWITGLSGSYSNVVGLPLAEAAMALSGLGYRW